MSYLGHALMENRHGLLVKTRGTQATGTAERDTALEMVQKTAASKRITVAGNKNFAPPGLCAEAAADRRDAARDAKYPAAGRQRH